MRETRLRRLRRVALQAALLQHALNVRERYPAATAVGDFRRNRHRDPREQCDPGSGQSPLDVAAMAQHEELPDQHAGNHDHTQYEPALRMAVGHRIVVADHH